MANLRRRSHSEVTSLYLSYFGDMQEALAEGSEVDDAEAGGEGRGSESTSTAKERMRVMANWDPSYFKEEIDWYTEFIHRTAPISVSWFQQPRCQERSGRGRVPLEVRGISAYHPPGNPDATLAVAPLENGTVCVWNINGSTARHGEIVGQSTEEAASGLGAEDAAITREGVCSVDSERGKAYYAIQSGKSTLEAFELDLTPRRLGRDRPADPQESQPHKLFVSDFCTVRSWQQSNYRGY